MVLADETGRNDFGAYSGGGAAPECILRKFTSINNGSFPLACSLTTFSVVAGRLKSFLFLKNHDESLRDIFDRPTAPAASM